ncbi:IS3 family transposase [Pseudomonas syringae group genomosp. 3]|uniref:IS3 family transposase n=1 Tax=Pseudomonas syringae group genomosp. 3 TaxID=251701 RepID=UPI0023A9443B|nr:IS3 family transposase [Pseudomonas syringae group genomosp. 3]
MAKYSEQFKLTVVKAYLAGNIGFRKVSSQFSIDSSLLRRWVANYKSHGHTGHRKPGLRYSEAFKRSVLEHKREHGLSLRQTAAHFGIGDPGQIVIWEQQHYSNDLAPYVPKRRKSVAMPKKPYPTAPVIDDDTQKTRDQLMAELEYLRMENAYPKKVGRVEGAATTAKEKALIVKQLRSRFSLCALLTLAGLARSTFYYQVQVQSRPDPDAALKQEVERIYHEERGLYGARRITAVIRNSGTLVNKKVVERLMAELGLRSVVRPKKYRSYKGTVGKIAPNLLERNFTAQRPNQKWVTDVTEFKVANRKLYLSPVMDLYNGQYQHAQYRQKLAAKGVKQSMSRKGNCLDNAAMESFFGTLKSEFFYLKRFESIEELTAGLEEYIRYYNHDRIKLKLGGLSPVKYRTQAAS